MRNWILRDHCDDSLIEAIERNVIERMMYFPSKHPQMDVIVEEDLILVDSKLCSSYLNAVCTTKFTSEDSLTRVKRAIQYFKDKDLPFTWLVGPTTPIEILQGILISCGMQKTLKMPCLILNMILFKIRPKYIPGFRIQHVLSQAALKDFAKVLMSLVEPQDKIEEYFHKIASLAFHSSDPTKLFVGYLHDEPMIIGELYLGAGLAGLNTLIDKSHLEVARDFTIDMTTKMVLMAKDHGYHYATTTIKQDVGPLYQSLGFKKRCEFFLFHEDKTIVSA